MPPIGRRTVLKLVAGSVAGTAALATVPWALSAARRGNKAAAAMVQDASLTIAFDSRMHTAISSGGKALTPYQPSESLLLAEAEVEDFALTGQQELLVDDPRHGAGHQLIVTGRSDRGIEKQVAATFFDRLPGLAVLQTRYRNDGDAALEVAGWRNAAHELADAPGGQQAGQQGNQDQA